MKVFVLVQKLKRETNLSENKNKNRGQLNLNTTEAEMIHYSWVSQILIRLLKLRRFFLAKMRF